MNLWEQLTARLGNLNLAYDLSGNSLFGQVGSDSSRVLGDGTSPRGG